MATMTLSRPFVSSPLASSSTNAGRNPGQRPATQRTPSFPSSQPLRPFPSISHAIRQPSGATSNKKPVKIIEPPENHKLTFTLDLTQAEFSRQE